MATSTKITLHSLTSPWMTYMRSSVIAFPVLPAGLGSQVVLPSSFDESSIVVETVTVAEHVALIDDSVLASQLVAGTTRTSLYFSVHPAQISSSKLGQTFSLSPFSLLQPDRPTKPTKMQLSMRSRDIYLVKLANLQCCMLY